MGRSRQTEGQLRSRLRLGWTHSASEGPVWERIRASVCVSVRQCNVRLCECAQGRGCDVSARHGGAHTAGGSSRMRSLTHAYTTGLFYPRSVSRRQTFTSCMIYAPYFIDAVRLTRPVCMAKCSAQRTERPNYFKRTPRAESVWQIGTTRDGSVASQLRPSAPLV